jgi:hypothetical protein
LSAVDLGGRLPEPIGCQERQAAQEHEEGIPSPALWQRLRVECGQQKMFLHGGTASEVYVHRFPGELEPHGFGDPRRLADVRPIGCAIDDDRGECALDRLAIAEDAAAILPGLMGGQRRPDLIFPVLPEGISEHPML